MELWIRSQDRTRLIKVNDIRCETFSIFGFSFTDAKIHLGKYKSEKRALEVLDEIQDMLNATIFEQTSNSILFSNKQIVVYEMPKE